MRATTSSSSTTCPRRTKSRQPPSTPRSPRPKARPAKTKKTTAARKIRGRSRAYAEPSRRRNPQDPQPASQQKPKVKSDGEIHNLLHIASEKYQDADGFVNVSSSGLYIKRVKPDFNVRAYGYSKLPELLAAFPNKYQIKRYEGKGGATIIAYKCL